MWAANNKDADQTAHMSLLFACGINRGSYMNAHVLLNLLNEFGERASFGFPNKFNKAKQKYMCVFLFHHEKT